LFKLGIGRTDVPRVYTVLLFLLAASVALIVPVLFYFYSNWSLWWVLLFNPIGSGVTLSVDLPILYLLTN